MKLIVYHPQGNANVRESAIGFAEESQLEEYYTSIACFPGSFLDKIAGFSYLSEIRRRSLNPLLRSYTRTSPGLEIGRILSSKAGFKSLTKQEKGVFSVQAVTQSLDKKVASGLKNAAKKGIDGIYAYEDGALFSFREAKRLCLNRFYDLPTGYWRAKLRILEEEKKRYPEWQSTITGLFDSNQKLASKDEEIKLADRIFVASRFTASTLLEYPGTLPPVQVIPYGFPDTGARREYITNNGQKPIKLLFVGNLSQQKGIANLFAAVDQLGKRVSLTLVGKKAVDDCAILNDNLAKHQWIPGLPHHEILQIMRANDVLVFPTLFDGFGLVISEAMSQGTPVIATNNSAGPDLIEHGKNGWLAEAGSITSLLAILENLIETPGLIARAGIEAMETARLRPWAIFRHELSEAIKHHYKSQQ